MTSQAELSAAGFIGKVGRCGSSQRKPIQKPATKEPFVASHNYDGDDNEHRLSIPKYNPLESSLPDDDRMPRRRFSSFVERSDFHGDWGVSKTCTREFPQTIESVADQAFDAVAGTLYSRNALDPNIAKNAASKSELGYRPIRSERDAGRMGIEIDGVEHLYRNFRNVSPERAIRHVSLILAAKLSLGESWESYEMERDNGKFPENRPVALYFNTVKQALAASQELQLLKRAELEDREIRNDKNLNVTTSYDMISIQCLGSDIPASMCLDRSHRRRYRGLTEGYVNATRGMIIIVQPTDYNSEYRPPGPAIGMIGEFQKLVARASVEELPSIAISPRFLSARSPWDGGVDQSGFQQSATYGGAEPPKGPTPWIMRDFVPPIYCWVGNAVRLTGPRQLRNSADNTDGGWGCYFSRVGLTQSVMDRGHPWHIYAAKECSNGKERLPTGYEYLASTRSASGRPTRDVIRRLMNEV